MRKPHTHTFKWSYLEAFYLCRCTAREATCWGCSRRLGIPYIEADYPYLCSDACRARWAALKEHASGSPLVTL